MIKIFAASLMLSFVVCSCAMPTTSVRTVDDRPTLAFKNAPPSAILFIDGLDMGVVDQYNGDPKTLVVEPGTHIIRIILNQDVIFEQRVFVEGSLKTISIR